jgi:hypothetical protein
MDHGFRASRTGPIFELHDDFLFDRLASEPRSGRDSIAKNATAMATIRIIAEDNVPAVAAIWGRPHPQFRWAYVTGSTNSFNFPMTAGALQSAFAGGIDIDQNGFRKSTECALEGRKKTVSSAAMLTSLCAEAPVALGKHARAKLFR